jgi:molecular chaperone GrpE
VRDDEEPPRIIDRRASHQADADASKENPTLNQSPDAMAEQLEQEKQKAEAYLANWQRAAADFQNYKRRVEAEREDLTRLTSAAFIINLLPIIDDFDRAMENVDASLAGLTWLEGVRLIQRKLRSLLEMNQVTDIEAEGQAFDPNIHEAVGFAEGEEGKVLHVAQKGYRLAGRVLRPALVIVGKQAGTS